MKKFILLLILTVTAGFSQVGGYPSSSTGSGSGGGGGGQYSSASATYTVGTVFFAPGGGAAAVATESQVQAPTPVAGSVGNLTAKLTAAPGAGNTITFTFRKAGADTTSTCAVTGASATTCADTHVFTVAANDLLDIKAVVTGGTVTAGVTLLWSLPGVAGPIGPIGPTGLGGGVITHAGSYTILCSDAVGSMHKYTGSGSTATLPNPVCSANWAVDIKAANAAGLAVSPNGLTIGGCTSTPLAQNQDVTVFVDGSNYTCTANGTGPTGAAGSNGTNGTNGSNGTNGTTTNGGIDCKDATGSTTAYTCPTPNPVPASYGPGGLLVALVPQTTNTTTTPTINIASLGVKNLKNSATTALTAGALVGGQPYLFEYDGTQFVQTGSGSTGSGSVVLTSGAGAPSAACTGPSTSNLVIYWDSTNKNIYYCNNATGPIYRQFLDDGTGSGKTGYIAPGGVTSGAEGFTVNDIAGTSILYIMPTVNGAMGQTLVDNGAATCPTLPSSAPTTCHQLIWSTSGYSTIDSNGSAVTQRAIVNYISGTNATITCVDNSGSTRTDCTVSATAGSATPVFPVNAQTATYQLLAADFTNFKTVAVASGTFTITAVASGSQPSSGTGVWVINYGSGVVTIARSGQNLNGQTASLSLPAGSATSPTGAFIVSDGTNYIVQLFGVAGTGAGTVVTQSGNYTVASADKGTIQKFTGASSTATLPATAPAMPWMVGLKSTNGTGLAVSGNGLTVTGCSSPTFIIQNHDMTVASDGSNYICNNIALPSDVGLSAVTNDVQTKAAIVPNTVPSAGQLPVGNAGGTAYAPVSLTQDCTISSAGVVTCLKTNNVSFGTAATTNTGTSGATLGLLSGNLTFGGTNAYGTPTSITLTNGVGLPLSGHTTQAANTIVMNATGSTAAPTASAAPAGGTSGCSGTTDAATYTAGTGWGCHQITGGTGGAATNVTTTFNASTMTFTCNSNTITNFILSTAVTANVTASAVASCNTGQIFTIAPCQDGTGGRTFALPTGFPAEPISPVASACTKFTFKYDGTNYVLLAKTVDSGPNAFGVETTAPGTPPASDFFWWGDSINHVFSYKANNSATISNTVVPDTGATNNFLTAISAGGAVSKAQPTLLNLATFSSANLATQLTDETGTGVTVFSASPALTGTPTAPTQASGDNTTAIATDAFVQSAIAAQVDMHNPVQAATTAALIFSPAYSNGASGVGATLTATSVGVLVVDGYTPVLNDRLLIKNQVSTFQNGCYVLTTVGVVVTTDYVLTRCTDFNQNSNIAYGDTFPVLQGTANANQQFTMNNNASITVGTTAITFAQTSGGSQLTGGTGITITGNSIALTVPVTGTNGGTGVNNGANTLTLAGNLITTGAFNTTFAAGATATHTLPTTSSTLARTDAGQTFTGVQTMTSPALTTPVITTDIHSTTAGGATVGTAALPFGSAFIGGSATNNIKITGTSAAARVFTLPDTAADTNFVMANTSTNVALVLHASATAGLGVYGAIAVTDLPAVSFTTPGATKTFSAGTPTAIFECTTTCTITMPVPAQGQQYCVRNANNVSTVITFSAIGSSAAYENTASTAYGTAGTGTLVSGGAVGDKICLIGKDTTHFDVFSFNGTWTVN